MNEGVVDRIRSASFTIGLRGYDRHEVDRFLDDLADALQAGTGDDDDGLGEVVRAELERIGEATKAILTDAHDAAEAIRSDAERRVRHQLAEANLRAEALQGDADEYAERTREEGDAYARKTRLDADERAEEVRREAEAAAAEIRDQASRDATQEVEDAQRRRRDIEAVIGDLEARRNSVVAELRRLATDAAGLVGGEEADSSPPENSEAAAESGSGQPGR